jgi:amino acid transporter
VATWASIVAKIREDPGRSVLTLAATLVTYAGFINGSIAGVCDGRLFDLPTTTRDWLNLAEFIPFAAIALSINTPALLVALVFALAFYKVFGKAPRSLRRFRVFALGPMALFVMAYTVTAVLCIYFIKARTQCSQF